MYTFVVFVRVKVTDQSKVRLPSLFLVFDKHLGFFKIFTKQTNKQLFLGKRMGKARGMLRVVGGRFFGAFFWKRGLKVNLEV